MKKIKTYEGFSFFKKQKQVETPIINDDVDKFTYKLKDFLESLDYEINVSIGTRNRVNVFYNPYYNPYENNDKPKYQRGSGEIDIVRLEPYIFEFYCSNSEVPNNSIREYIHNLCETYTQKYLGTKSERVTDKSKAMLLGTTKYSVKAIPEIINDLTKENYEIFINANKYNL